jgi:hypothetical protein
MARVKQRKTNGQSPIANNQALRPSAICGHIDDDVVCHESMAPENHTHASARWRSPSWTANESVDLMATLRLNF